VTLEASRGKDGPDVAGVGDVVTIRRV
jgi:hypothetical protein